MSALARYFLLQGVRVSGYDKTPSTLTQELESEGIEIHYDDWGEKALEGVDLVVYTPAIPKTLIEFQAFQVSEIPMLKRAKILGEISKDYFTIAVAGTHGKTTITSMVAHFLNTSGVAINAFIGGIANNYNSNLVLNKEAKIMVVEADEFDRSFLHLHPDIAIISSMDADHLDIYENKNYLQESFFEFVGNIKSGGTLVMHESLDLPPDFNGKLCSYGHGEGVNYQLLSERIELGKQQFVVNAPGEAYSDFRIALPGQHNLLNATAAIAVSDLLEVNKDILRKSVDSYKGVKRRFEFRINTSEQVLIDDYAHHPTEINAAVSAAREMFPGQKLMGVFQPHLFTRTRDFADGFAEALSKLDCLALLDIYPARELPIEGVDSQMLLEKVQLEEKYLLAKEELTDFVEQHKYPVVLMMGAGDIDRLVQPVENRLLNNA